MELILNMLAEASTTEISKVETPDGFEETMTLQNVAETLQEMQDEKLEATTGRKVISKKNSKTPKSLDE